MNCWLRKFIWIILFIAIVVLSSYIVWVKTENQKTELLRKEILESIYMQIYRLNDSMRSLIKEIEEIKEINDVSNIEPIN